MTVKEMKGICISEHVWKSNDAHFPEIPRKLPDRNWRGPIIDTAAI
jgi:hypothetical protein